MKAVSPSTMREIDKRAIEVYGVPGIVLMENACRAVAVAAKRRIDEVYGKKNFPLKVAVVCGKGNNGGDGFGAARHLANMGFEVSVFLASPSGEVSGDAAVNLKVTKNMGIPVIELKDTDGPDKIRGIFEGFHSIVDALFGTGLRGEVKGLPRELIEAINASGLPVIAVDIPSGICGRTGRVLGAAVRADVTVTMGLLKVGLLLYPGAAYAGRVVVVDIGIPRRVFDEFEAEALLLMPELVESWVRPPAPDAHKGDMGRVFILAGSRGMTGAAALSGLGAARCGAGLVTLGVPESLNDILEVKVTEVMTLPLPDTGEGTLSEKALEPALEFARRCDAVVLGPGLSRHRETEKFVRSFVAECERPMVIDADGINNLSGAPEILKDARAPVVLTPHPGEMARLLSTTPREVQQNRWDAVRRAGDTFGCTVVLKGARTLIYSPGNPVYVNPTGNPGMATGGSGDVLAGMIGALLGRGLDALEASAAAVYLHGLAGDAAAEKKGEIPLVAGDIVENIPEAFKRLQEGERSDECHIQAYQG
ncbi:MAG: NAD(P)H-hydrate dehydratase [Bacillota bacterium]|nr:MAG: bifunctional ADP-dependent NAD(P)H-hydrate dehydratase/NAD(P)H-hydrate epimerase [Bacillota bacterium]